MIRHSKISVPLSIILLNLIFETSVLSIFCGIFIPKFGGVIHFAVEVWSWKLCQIKFFIGVWRRNPRLARRIKTNHRVTSRPRFIMKPLIWHNFQDQTSTAKQITPPNSGVKMPQKM